MERSSECDSGGQRFTQVPFGQYPGGLVVPGGSPCGALARERFPFNSSRVPLCSTARRPALGPGSCLREPWTAGQPCGSREGRERSRPPVSRKGQRGHRITGLCWEQNLHGVVSRNLGRRGTSPLAPLHLHMHIPTHTHTPISTCMLTHGDNTHTSTPTLGHMCSHIQHCTHSYVPLFAADLLPQGILVKAHVWARLWVHLGACRE